MPDLRPGIG